MFGRPAQRLGPEESDLPGSVAGNLAEEAAAGQERAPGLDAAELVALGINQHDVAFLRELADLDTAQIECRRDRVLLVGEAGAGQVEVHP